MWISIEIVCIPLHVSLRWNSSWSFWALEELRKDSQLIMQLGGKKSIARVLKFRDFFRAYLNIFSLLRHEARRMAKRKERSKTFFNVAFRNLLQSDFFSDPRLRYIKQAPLVIINERMSYCELFFPRAFVDAKINVAIEMVFSFFNKLDVWSDSTFSTS